MKKLWQILLAIGAVVLGIFAMSAGSGNKKQFKKDLKDNCCPPFDVDSLPASLDLLRLKGIGEMEEEPTIGDVLDACVSDNYSKISTEMTTDATEKLIMLSEQKGISMGEMIEKMINVYEKTQ